MITMIPPHPKNGKSGKVSNNVKEGQMDPGPIMVNNIPMRHQMENIQAVQGLPMMNGDGGYYQGVQMQHINCSIVYTVEKLFGVKGRWKLRN